MTEPRVLVHLMGGVGNQLFQYAAGLSLTGQEGDGLVFDLPTSQGLGLTDLLGAGSVPVAPPSVRRAFGLSGNSQSMATRVLIRLKREAMVRSGRLALLRETATSAVLPPDRVAGRCVLLGWFIHPAWYSGTVDLVAARVGSGLRDHPAFALARSSGTTVISFRRGDFVRWGWDLGTEYYVRALEHLDPIDGPCWLVGDDELFLEFACTWLATRGIRAERAPLFAGSRGRADLALLAGARTVVMSNSTFCWWGVAAGDTEPGVARRIIVPAPWSSTASPDPTGQPGLVAGITTSNWTRVASAFGSGPG